MTQLRILLLTAVAPVAWGTTYLITTELLPGGHPLLAALLRSLPAGLLALVIGKALPRGSWLWRSAVLGTLNIGAFFALLFVAAERLPGGVAAAVAGVQPLIIIGIGCVVLRERTPMPATAAGVAGAVGVALVVIGPSAQLDMIGVSAALGGIAATASGVVLTKRWGRPAGIGPIAYAGWQLTAGGLVLLPLTLLLEPIPAQVDLGAIAGYVWLGTVGGLLAYVLWFRGIQQLPVAAPGMLALLSPVVATVLGVVVAGETFTLTQSAGIAIVLVALVSGQAFALRRDGARSGSPAPRAEEPARTR
ncbi:EamA family transporter [Microbacterium esteraromaticum]|uniref:EamA family transporter n=1 Tax=Microbacterium esteraromaticum TaxID=57043 RepID=UPI00195E5157|nr:EamA family transporter [Microbacterium esteraromaticum]MBM7467448.1 putative blue pigment (indigoidine) exporter [Microbacterium esteraromaticum]